MVVSTYANFLDQSLFRFRRYIKIRLWKFNSFISSLNKPLQRIRLSMDSLFPSALKSSALIFQIMRWMSHKTDQDVQPYRIAIGPQQGRKAFMIRTIRPLDRPDPGLERAAKANRFSLHAGVSCEGHQKNNRERLCRYIARPAVAVPRPSLSSTGKVL